MLKFEASESEGLPEKLPYQDLSEEPTYTADQLVSVMQINAATRHRHNLDQKFYSKALGVARIKDEEIARLTKELEVANDRAEIATGAYNTLYERNKNAEAEHQKQIREVIQDCRDWLIACGFRIVDMPTRTQLSIVESYMGGKRELIYEPDDVTPIPNRFIPTEAKYLKEDVP